MTTRNRPEIVPALIPKDFYELEDKVAQVTGHVKNVHIDMCDGILTRSTSWPKDGDKIFEQILIGERGLPEWEDVNYEVHLMTAHPENYIYDWIMAGAYRVVVQIESFFPGFAKGFDDAGTKRLEKMLEKLKTDHKYDSNNDDDFYQVGISVALDTSLDVIKPLIEKFNFVQIMSIPSMGFQGVSFDERAYERIKEIREFTKKDITVDGGVNEKNILELSQNGVNRLVVGSAIFNNDVPSEMVDSLNALFEV
jgi:ribulose-phosphate 3-epimerase